MGVQQAVKPATESEDKCSETKRVDVCDEVRESRKL
jgi:hypothetical protein